MNLCPNSINSKLFLQKTRYPGDSIDSYYITAEEVRSVLDAGKIPEICPAEQADGPKIAVLLALEKHPDRAEADYYIPETYVRAITRHGGQPVFIGFDKTAEQLENISPNAVLLPGGDFRFPDEWIECSQPEGGSLRREQAYETCIHYAQKHCLPLFGICAGEQVLAGMNGGRLKTVAGHRANPDQFSHGIKIASDTLLHRICGLDQAKVNSNHHMAVCPEKSGEYAITAMADDGTAEAIEPKSPRHWFTLGVQWHPERFACTDDELTERLFSAFVKAARGGVAHSYERIPFAEAPLVEISDPHFIVDLMYARTDNISGRAVYQETGLGNRAFVRRELWERLQKVIPRLERHRLKMKICDAYRPAAAHMGLKAAIHEQGSGLFASRGELSKHCHGTAVDVILTDLDGNELPYPTKVDCYTAEFATQVQTGETKAFYEYTRQGRLDYKNPSMTTETANREQLRELMESVGLQSYIGEWWHYEMPDEFNLVFPVIEW